MACMSVPCNGLEAARHLPELVVAALYHTALELALVTAAQRTVNG